MESCAISYQYNLKFLDDTNIEFTKKKERYFVCKLGEYIHKFWKLNRVSFEKFSFRHFE